MFWAPSWGESGGQGLSIDPSAGQMRAAWAVRFTRRSAWPRPRVSDAGLGQPAPHPIPAWYQGPRLQARGLPGLPWPVLPPHGAWARFHGGTRPHVAASSPPGPGGSSAGGGGGGEVRLQTHPPWFSRTTLAPIQPDCMTAVCPAWHRLAIWLCFWNQVTFR